MKQNTETKPTTAPQPRDAVGRALATDGLPAHAHHRARVLAGKGIKIDPLGLVTPELIAIHRPAKTAAGKFEEKTR